MGKTNIFVLSGPSATGKGTICKKIKSQMPVKIAISMTTRKKRQGEEDGVHYHFVDKACFEDLIEKNGFVEYAKVFDNYYGTPMCEIEDAHSTDVILEIDVQGGLQVMRKLKGSVGIFLLPSSMEALKQRMLKRGTEDSDSMKKRLSKAIDEISELVNYEYCIVNDDLEKATSELAGIITGMKGESPEGLLQNKVTKEKADALIDKYKEEYDALSVGR